MDLLDASTHDDCTCMERTYSVSLKDDFNSTRDRCIRHDFKLHRKAWSFTYCTSMTHFLSNKLVWILLYVVLIISTAIYCWY